MNKNKEIKEIFAERLLELMTDKGLNAKQLSETLNIPRTTISSWKTKKKKISIDCLCVLAEFFGVSTDYLLGRED